MEIVQQDIINPNLQVGSGCEWIGKGAEPQWDNPKSTKAYDHIERHHGPKVRVDQLRGRAGSKQIPQGQWLSEEDWVKAEQIIPKYPGRYIIDFKRPIGRVYQPDGTIIENVTCAFIKRKDDGTLNCGYPVLNSFNLI
ncbi:MAG TPA: hypothetical protein VK203_21765 [Nostocaceae cyanobacterium]|nr:hypothetical protein [Nostocaceae cyanobacterium]